MSNVDTSTAAATDLARRLSSVPLDMTVAEFDAAGAMLRAIAAERDALAAALDALLIAAEGRYGLSLAVQNARAALAHAGGRRA